MKIQPANGATRSVVNARYDDHHNVVFVFNNDALAGYCCFDPTTFKDDAAFIAWAGKALHGAKLYKGSYAADCCDPDDIKKASVDCPPPVKSFTKLLPHVTPLA